MINCKGRNCGRSFHLFDHSPECRIQHAMAYSGLSENQEEILFQQIDEEFSNLRSSHNKELARTNGTIVEAYLEEQVAALAEQNSKFREALEDVPDEWRHSGFGDARVAIAFAAYEV